MVAVLVQYWYKLKTYMFFFPGTWRSGSRSYEKNGAKQKSCWRTRRSCWNGSGAWMKRRTSWKICSMKRSGWRRQRGGKTASLVRRASAQVRPAAGGWHSQLQTSRKGRDIWYLDSRSGKVVENLFIIVEKSWDFGFLSHLFRLSGW